MEKTLKERILEERKKLKVKLKLSQLVASIIIMEKHLNGQITENSSWLPYHTSKSMVLNLLDDDEVIKELVSNHFVVVSRKSDTDEIFDIRRRFLTEEESVINFLIRDTINIALYYNQINTGIRYEYGEGYRYDACQSPVFKLLLNACYYEMLKKLFLSEKISMKAKVEMYQKCAYFDRGMTDGVFSRKMPYEEEVFESEELQKKLAKIFEEIMASLYEHNVATFYGCVANSELEDSEEPRFDKKVRYLINVAKVDPNSVFFTLSSFFKKKFGFNEGQDITITAAAKAYSGHNYLMGEYLYSLSDFQTVDNKVRENSDIVIIKSICEKYSPRKLINFLTLKSFEYTPKNFNCIMDILMHKQLEAKEYISDSEKEEIISLFLTNSSKEDLEKIKQLVQQFLVVTDRKVINERRQAVAECLRQNLDALLEGVPAKMNVGVANARTFKHPIKKHRK